MSHFQAATCPEALKMTPCPGPPAALLGKEMQKDKAICGIARRTDRSLQMKKGSMYEQDKISAQKQLRGDL